MKVIALCYSDAVDIERTMQFIVESQARGESRMEKAEIRATAMEKRIDRRLDAITKLLQQGMRMLVKTDTSLKELAQSHKRWPKLRRRRIGP